MAQRLQKLLRIKPSPLRQGANGPYIFIHINKTAGTSIGNAIGLPFKSHLTAKQVINKIGQQRWDSAYKFSMVRNPWDRLVSLYEYRRKKNKTEIASRNIPFTEWVNMTIGQNQDAFFYNNPKSFQTQADWLKDKDEKIDVSFVGRFESIQNDFNQIRTAIGCSADLPHFNAVTRSNYHDYYNNETREIVASWYSEDISVFGYTF